MTRLQIDAAIDATEKTKQVFLKQVEAIENNEGFHGEERIIALTIAGVCAAMAVCRIKELEAMSEIT